jgi:hypothetical protein
MLHLPGIPFSENVKNMVLTSFAILAEEFFHASGSVYQFLLSGKERVAVGTNFHV